MSDTWRFCRMALTVSLVWAARPDAWACAACFGQQSDSPMAVGMNWGIMSLLVIILAVLGGVAGFFVFIVRRSGSTLPFGEPGGPETADPHPQAQT